MAKEKAIRGPFRIGGRKSFYVEIDRKRRSLDTTDLKKANKLVDGIREKYRTMDQKKEESRPLTFEKFRDQYLEWAEKIQPVKTFKANRLALRKLEPICRGLGLDQIGAYHLDQMTAIELGRGLKVGAVNCYIRHCKSVLGQAVRWGLLPEHPFIRCKQQRANKKPPRALDKVDIDRLLESIDDCYDHLVIRAYLITGRSRSELTRLQWQEIDFVRGRYYITRTKTHLSKWYPLGSGFREILESLGPEKDGLVFYRNYHPDTLSHKVKAYMIDAGLGHHSLHHLRHSFARLYLETGGSMYALQQLLGHSQLATTSIYSSLSVGTLAKEIERVVI